MAPERSDARVSGMAHCNRWWHVHGAQPNVRHINLASAVRLETPLPQRHPHPSRHEGPLPKHSHRPEHRGIAIKPPPSRRGQRPLLPHSPPPVQHHRQLTHYRAPPTAQALTTGAFGLLRRRTAQVRRPYVLGTCTMSSPAPPLQARRSPRQSLPPPSR